MSLYNDASLVMVPSGYKDGTLYSAKPTNGDGDFTFSRGSNLAATRTNSEGLIQKGRENLLLQSNSFDTTWTNNNTTETSGQADKDGGTDAWLVNSTASFGSIVQSISNTNGVYSLSVYAKAGTNNWMLLRMLGSSSSRAWFDLENGVLGSTDGPTIESKIESVGGGWYRCSVTGNMTSFGQVLIYPTNANLVVGTSGNIIIQDAQLEVGLVSTDVITTTTTTEQAGILEDMPRLDYSGGATCGSLILEPQRSNLVTNSEYVSSSDYVVGNWTGTITTNTTETTSPEGLYNATKYVKSGASDRVYFHSSQPDGAYTGSVWLKAASGSENTTIEISVRRFGGGGGSTSKLVTITNEWQRFDVTATNLTGGTTTAMYVADFSMAGTATEFYSYGMQIEAGSYPTSYIPTYGASSTRSKDVCESTSVSSIIGQTEGTLFTQVGDFPQEVNGRIFAISDGSSSNYITIIKSGSNNDFAVYVNDGGVTQVAYTGSASLTGNDKIGVAYANNDYAIYVNGTQVHTDTSASVPACSAIWIGQRENGSKTYIAGGSVKQALLFKTRLSNDELASLTTI